MCKLCSLALPPGEASTSQATALPPGEASPSLATALPPGEASTPPASTLPPSTREGITLSQANTPPQATSHSYSLRSTQSGQASNTTRASRQGNRCPLTIGQLRLPRRSTLPPGKATPPTPPSRPPQGSSKEEPNPKWVINLSNKPLTPAQRSVLAKGPNFVVTPRQPPNLEYITAIEAACTKLSQQDAEELRADINRVLRSSHPPNPA